MSILTAEATEVPTPAAATKTTSTPSHNLSQPVVHSGALNTEDYPRTYLTPAIGVQFEKSFQLKEVLEWKDTGKRDALLQDLALEISLRGVAFLPAQDGLIPRDLEAIALHLGTLAGKPSASTLHIHPTQELGENGQPLTAKITNVASDDGRIINFQDERSVLQSQGWHTDISFEPVPGSYSLLRMHTLPPTGGDTLFSSGYHHLSLLSKPMQSFLSNLTATHDAAMFRHQAERNGYALHQGPRGAPENVGQEFRSSHPVIRTNPTTGKDSLYVNATFTTKIDQLSIDESDALLKYLFKVQHESIDGQVRYRWSPNDLAIWDNRCALHTATFDYTERREGDRAVCCGEKPFYRVQ